MRERFSFIDNPNDGEHNIIARYLLSHEVHLQRLNQYQGMTISSGSNEVAE